MQEILWKSNKPPGMEYCVVIKRKARWAITGELVRKAKEGPIAVKYEILTDLAWKTREVKVEEFFRGASRGIQLKVREGEWWVNGKKSPELTGCVDVDLEVSPATNTLAIRRARLKAGESADLTVVWVRFPSLAVIPFQQSYSRISNGMYVYRSSTGFTAELEVDEFGLVQRYGDFWKALQ